MGKKKRIKTKKTTNWHGEEQSQSDGMGGKYGKDLKNNNKIKKNEVYIPGIPLSPK